jgi:hypothetical protein
MDRPVHGDFSFVIPSGNLGYTRSAYFSPA